MGQERIRSNGCAPAAQSDVIAIAAKGEHSVALKRDGSVLAWGWNESGQIQVPTAAQSGVKAIAAGNLHTVALKNGGTVLAWGWNGDGQIDTPPEAQSGVIAIAAGYGHTVALKTDGSVVAWGRNDFGQTDVPAAAQSGVISIGAGSSHTIALKADGTVLAWGYNGSNQTTVPAGLSGVLAIASGGGHNVALVGTVPPSTFAGWASGFGLAGASAAAEADPDGDGVPNALEYVLGSNPTPPGGPAAPTVNLTADSMLFTFPRIDNSETADVTLTIEASTDLVTWPAVFAVGPTTAACSPGVTVLENGTAPDTITVALVLDAHPQIFARVRVTIAP